MSELDTIKIRMRKIAEDTEAVHGALHASMNSVAVIIPSIAQIIGGTATGADINITMLLRQAEQTMEAAILVLQKAEEEAKAFVLRI